ncbi:M55 family metallopeptidase [Paratissierella segnis]|jgi:D-amino peptidase|uniref:M55 family metallopeptidase n=1 Tax=Paratissierella segnis TaxID=2763679 RepID=A0A926EXL3_9FIRM|nr:M55 family metallopeptidase [Paratissierella segnis]MBC8589412.1 M55 family metallopeptidase [Paratissierella segnis]
MKIFISADIEGVSGSTAWDETERGNELYDYFANQMTLEVKAACEGANEAGAKEIVIKDAHSSGRNIDHRKLPKNAKLIRSWAGHPFSMAEELDDTFDAIIFIGYHSAAGRDTNPLSHTMNTSLDCIKLNNQIASEFLLHAYIAAYLDVPIALLSGDAGLCEEVKELNENIKTIAVKEGKGNSTINLHPELACDLIKQGVKEILSKDLSYNRIELPKSFILEMRYREHKDAYKRQFYPGVIKTDENTISLKSNDYMDIVKAVHFLA